MVSRLLKHFLISLSITFCIVLCQNRGFAALNHTTQSSSMPVSSISPVTITLLSEEETIQPGRPFWVTFHIKIEDGWHAYWKNPGNTGFPLSIQWQLPQGFQASALHWQTPHRLLTNDSIAFGYENDVYLLAEITPPSPLSASPPAEINATISWLVCSENMCLPGNTQVSIPLPTSSNLPLPDKRWVSQFKLARSLIPQKIWSFRSKLQENSLTVEITTPYNDSFQVKKVVFFPESNKIIDYSIEPLLSHSDNANLTLEMKLLSNEGDNTETANPDNLKGVLVLEGIRAGENFRESLEVDLLANISEPFSLNDASKIVKNKVPQEIAYSPINSSAELNSNTVNDNDLSDNALNIESDNPSSNVSFEGISTALLFAFLGGSLLNLMPCVLPVLSFKVLSFIKMAGQKRSLTLKHGLIFALGVLISFWILAGTLLLLQAYGKSVGWGFQLQEPIFVAALATVFLIFSLGLFGVFEVGISMASWAGQAQGRPTEKLSSSFFSGVLATAVATPCTGPFLGAAIGMAVTLPPIWAILIFTFLALGMAFPYILLSAFPNLLRILPKPGNWMERFKEFMGFLLIATTLWLIWVFGAQTNNSAVFMLLAGLLFVSLATWIWGTWGNLAQKPTTRYIGRSFALAVFIFGALVVFYAPKVKEANYQIAAVSPDQNTVLSGNQWEPFSPDRITKLQSQGIPVLVDFTAKWCLVCQANHIVFNQDDVSNKLDELGVVRMIADWTTGDPQITDELRKFERNSVPLYLLYGADASTPPQLLPQVLTPGIVLDHLDEISSEANTALKR